MAEKGSKTRERAEEAARRNKEHLKRLWEAVETSLWFVPAVMAAAAAALAGIAAWGDRILGNRAAEDVLFLIYVSTPANARELVSTLLSSIITMASLVFSITVVVLTLAASQFGPRLIRSFMASRSTQVTLGVFVMTMVYCLLALVSLGWREGDRVFGYLTVTVAIGLALGCVGLLVFYIHSLARSIMSETVIEKVGRELDSLIEGLRDFGEPEPDPRSLVPDDVDDRGAFLGPGGSGYVQAIEFESIAEAAAKADALVVLFFRAGDYVVEDGKGIAVYPAERASPELSAAIVGAVALGPHRTPVQDIEFSIRHLVEIAVRALSPGINDPYTAVSVVNRLSASLSRIMGRALPEAIFRDEGGALRVLAPRPSYATIISAAFDQIRQNGAEKPVVMIHMFEAVIRIAAHTRTADQRLALGELVEDLVEAAEEGIAHSSDIADVRRWAEKTRDALARAQDDCRISAPAPPE